MQGGVETLRKRGRLKWFPCPCGKLPLFHTKSTSNPPLTPLFPHLVENRVENSPFSTHSNPTFCENLQKSPHIPLFGQTSPCGSRENPPKALWNPSVFPHLSTSPCGLPPRLFHRQDPKICPQRQPACARKKLPYQNRPKPPRFPQPSTRNPALLNIEAPADKQ